MQKQKTPDQVQVPKKTDQTAVDAVETPSFTKEMTEETIICGANEAKYSIAGKTIAYVRENLKDMLNIDPAAAPLMNGNPVTEDTVVVANSIIEWVKSSGTKGATPYTV